jgi:twitching motility two-component system response regulator PilH
VLVVNDCAVILEVFRALFEDEGYRVTINKFVTLDSKETLNEIEELNPDVILLDFLIGKEPLGWELLQLLRMTPGTAHIPIVVCTGLHQVQELAPRLDKLAIEAVIKPFEIDDALSAVQRAVDGVRPFNADLPVN